MLGRAIKRAKNLRKFLRIKTETSNGRKLQSGKMKH